MRTLKRALRRSRRQNKIKRALRSYVALTLNENEKQQWAVRNYDNLKKGSCPMCGHRRRSEGLTLQERWFLMALKDETW